MAGTTRDGSSRQVRRQQDGEARMAQSQSLVERLESRIALAAKERAHAMQIANAPILVDPHRDHHAYALGADLVDCGLAMGDALPLRGLMSTGPANVASLLEQAAKSAPDSHVTRLWSDIINVDRARLSRRGAAVDRRRAEVEDGTSVEKQIVFANSLDRAANIVDGHRDHHAYVLGMDAFYCGQVADDALAMLGLMSAGPQHVAAALREASVGAPREYVGRLWNTILGRSADDYKARGRFVTWQRRWVRYKVDLERWLDSLPDDGGHWRDRAMTVGQRHLVRDTAILLGLIIPYGMNRGQAHDFLMRKGGNAVYRKELSA